MDIAIVILNYLSVNDTIEYIDSIYKYYKNKVRIIIVDNNTPQNKLIKLEKYVERYENIILLKNNKNIGFAKGNNIGIRKALDEDYKYIICSNNDILFNENNILENLLFTAQETKCAVIGPKILTLNGNQNPVLKDKINKKEAKRIFKEYTIFNIIKKIMYHNFNIQKLHIGEYFKYFKINNNTKKLNLENYKNVYCLHGAFMMFTPIFFKKFKGFDENTFLYFEELILAEMLDKSKYKSIYEPSVSVFHKEDRSSKLAWGGQNKLKPLLIARNSSIYWYNNYILKR